MGCGSSARIAALEEENCKYREQLETTTKAADLRVAAQEDVLAQRLAKEQALVSEHEAERAKIKAQFEEGLQQADIFRVALEAEKLELQQRRAKSKRASARDRQLIEAENQALRESLESDRQVAESRQAALVVQKALLMAEKARCEDSALTRVRALEVENTALQRDIEGHQADAVSAEAMLRADMEGMREAAQMREEAARMREEGLQTEVANLVAELELQKEAASKASEAQLIAHQVEMSQLRSDMEKRIDDLHAKIADQDARIAQQDAAAKILQRTNTQLLADRAAAAERESAKNRTVLQSRSSANDSLAMAMRQELEL